MLEAFRHKGYWYHGKQREKQTMLLFGELVGKGDWVIEVGEHAVRENNEAHACVGAVATAIVDVECTTLDDFLASNVGAAPSLIKIDVEGAERSVLKGMTEVLKNGRMALMVEVTEHAEDVKALLEGRWLSFVQRSQGTRH